jgi:hypothetical protein
MKLRKIISEFQIQKVWIFMGLIKIKTELLVKVYQKQKRKKTRICLNSSFFYQIFAFKNFI